MEYRQENNVHITWVPLGEEWEAGLESLFKSIMVENVPQTGRDLEIRVLKLIVNLKFQ